MCTFAAGVVLEMPAVAEDFPNVCYGKDDPAGPFLCYDMAICYRGVTLLVPPHMQALREWPLQYYQPFIPQRVEACLVFVASLGLLTQ